ncbi:hypothetical protein [Xanthovirga aplysinae]|nr:hypothetical protein [Xanthovirga aplysinae]
MRIYNQEAKINKEIVEEENRIIKAYLSGSGEFFAKEGHKLL